MGSRRSIFIGKVFQAIAARLAEHLAVLANEVEAAIAAKLTGGK
jgi:hypothetical protein